MGKELPLSLVKYTTASVGISILKSKTIRWSAPHVFSDPFENSAHSTLSFDQYDLTKASVRLIASMIFSRDDPRGEANPIKKAVRRWRAEDRFNSEEEAQEALTALLPTMIAQRFTELTAYMTAWINYAHNVRVLCLADNFEEMSCWELFADHHKGIAVRFKVGEGNCVLEPKRVSYRSTRNVITTLREQVGIFVGEFPPNDPSKLEEKLLVKTKQLAEQKEWRCIELPKVLVDPDSDGMSVAYEDRPFAVGEVTAVYLGASISEHDRNEVLSILAKEYPKAKVYQAKPKEAEYSLEFLKSDGSLAKDLAV